MVLLLAHNHRNFASETKPIEDMKNILTTTIMALASTVCLAACGQASKNNSMKQDENKRVLVAYFSRTGENYGVGNITKGNTSIVAEMIAEQTGGDIFEIKPVNEYPTEYEPCTEVAKEEKEANARPEIKENKSAADYDVVFIGYPIWWGDAPMPVYTWIDKQQWQGKTVIPFCTHEGSGLSDTERLIGRACKGAKVGEGFELTGTTAQKRQAEAKKAVEKWLKEIGMAK